MRIVIDDNCLGRQGGNGGASYDDSAILARLQKLENRTDNFVKDVTVSREGNKVKFTYTRVDGTSSEAEFEDKDTIALAYDDTELRNKVAQLEAKEDNDKQTLSLQGRTLSISNGNSVTLPASGGSMASAISAYSTSDNDSNNDLFVKGDYIEGANGSSNIPALSDGELQLIEFDSYSGIRVKDPTNGVLTLKVNKHNENPSFGSGEFPNNANLYIEIRTRDETLTELVHGFLDTGDITTRAQNYNTYLLDNSYTITANVVFDIATKNALITFFKDSHVYTTKFNYTYDGESTMTGEFDFPVYADFGLEEKFKKLKLYINH